MSNDYHVESESGIIPLDEHALEKPPLGQSVNEKVHQFQISL